MTKGMERCLFIPWRIQKCHNAVAYILISLQRALKGNTLVQVCLVIS